MFPFDVRAENRGLSFWSIGGVDFELSGILHGFRRGAVRNQGTVPAISADTLQRDFWP
jgi:hypothetical protein